MTGNNLRVKLAWTLAVTLTVVVLCGCASPTAQPSPSSDLGKPVNTSVHVGVRALDVVNNVPVPDVPIYFISCSPRNNDTRDLHFTNVTGSDGWATFDVNYTLEKGDVIYLGASSLQSLIDADFAAGAFNGSGYTGSWQSFSYALINSDQDRGEASIVSAITVDRDAGKMI